MKAVTPPPEDLTFSHHKPLEIRRIDDAAAIALAAVVPFWC